ncbi:hypothetical protein P153DRAFT_167797 [Dothidotthia symphoricarpi CBS 119687]|uniref:Uncharacterized protein n=1 Tax=Dothidotthia symphoricarpi CBS 119687 TaxID=1392245 RepID=A0A6A6APZ0_9PLEO|nr:uncharacterized protein P153DRAFT_167797 [Dothidotthia symphoricarpi CBS 119687]KAF2132581.1 hypothetical protein P153DRAFT_167797 [Dothidotthia symphoricarpi CBS 119687]
MHPSLFFFHRSGSRFAIFYTFRTATSMSIIWRFGFRFGRYCLSRGTLYLLSLVSFVLEMLSQRAHQDGYPLLFPSVFTASERWISFVFYTRR